MHISAWWVPLFALISGLIGAFIMDMWWINEIRHRTALGYADHIREGRKLFLRMALGILGCIIVMWLTR